MGVFEFLVVASAVSTAGWVANNWIRARHGYPIAEEGDAGAGRKQLESVGAENRQLKDQVGRLEARLAVLERIATDPAERTAREIEQLR